MEIGPIRLADIVIFITVIGGLFATIRWINRWMKQISHLLEDFLGEEARPGVDPRPGVMERMKTNEQTLGRIEQAQIQNTAMLDQHIRESRAFSAEAIKRAAAAGIELPAWPTLPPRPTDGGHSVLPSETDGQEGHRLEEER